MTSSKSSARKLGSFRLKPEYCGTNQPLEQSQIKRKANPVGPSPAAIAALLQFYENQ